MKITQAQLSDAGKIAPLFDAYRQFYEQSSDLTEANNYLCMHLKNETSVIFMAISENGQCIGFTQLYPTFCSVSMRPAWILYDLFVSEDARKKGVADQLMQAAQNFAAQSGATWLRLETALTNIPGQKLYEKLGWKRENDFYTYFFHLTSSEQNT
ncbi:GNAT family N-acetyltransferase [Kordiimonas aquimaris]|uniref:GNAT family N-acetyltransferase n=1 Tax=Kordiimonas aquimaris TaxID=707591 RepID=UPI0021D33322|nr:GNAT family N-acetyltransferase [Kordiimonas aquimaris]